MPPATLISLVGWVNGYGCVSCLSPYMSFSDHPVLIAPLSNKNENLGQTYEGGVSAKHGIEAHGAYAFCALGCLSIIDSPHRSVRR